VIPVWRNRSPVHRTLVGLAAAAVLTLLYCEGTATHFAPTTAATVLVGALAVAALFVPQPLFFRTALLAVLASVALTVVTLRLHHRPEVSPGLTEMSALLLITARAVRRQRPLSGAVLVLCAPAAAAVLWLREPETEYGLLELVEPVLFCMAVTAFVLGLYLRLFDRHREREKRAVLQHQRLEYARELHDFVAHHVTAIVAQARAARFVATAGHGPEPAQLDDMFARIERSGSEAMTSMRTMVSVLRAEPEPAGSGTSDGGFRDAFRAKSLGTSGGTGKEAGAGGAPGTAARPAATSSASAYGPECGGELAAALRPFVEVSAGAGPPAELVLDPRLAGRTLPPATLTPVRRLVQEALTNVRKHAANAQHVTVQARFAGAGPHRLTVTVTDDGRPDAAAASAHPASGYGLLGLTERFEAAGGRLTAGPAAGGGWQVAAELPLDPVAAA